jgi:hypothetical protein
MDRVISPPQPRRSPITRNPTPNAQSYYPQGIPGLIMAKPCGNPLEVDLDVWPLVEELVPLLEEIERIEAIAAGKTEPEPEEEG